MLLYQPSLAQEIDAAPLEDYSEIPGVTLLTGLLALLHQHPELNTGAILEHWRDHEEGRHLFKLAEWSPHHEGLELLPELQGCLKQLRRQHLDNRINFLNEASRERSLSKPELEEYKQLQAMLNEA